MCRRGARPAMALPLLALGCCVLLSVCGVASSQSCSIQVQNGKFSLMVGIKADVPRSRQRGDRHDYADLKASIVEKFSKASTWLYRATRQRAYIGDVTVVVPSAWSGDPDFKCSRQCETYERAKIKIRPPRVDSRGRELHGAYVVPGRCGEEGMLMHLTPSRISAASHQASPAEKMIIHEFAHLRYGVGDEYYQSVFGYGADGKPSACSVRVEPKRSRFTGKYSGFDPKDAQGSFMWHQFREQILHFCDNGGNSQVRHNRLAANSHNQRCNRQSVWEVLNKSPDFCCGRNRPMSTPWGSLPKPTFRFVRECQGGSCEVIVVDVSASMKGRMMEVSQAVASVIDRAQATDNLGLVTFAEDPRIVAGLQVANAGYKSYLKTSLPTDDDVQLEKTNIVRALQRAAQLLGVPTCQQKRVTIFSDCGETTPEKVTDAMVLMLQQNGIQLNSRTFDDNAPKCMLPRISQLSEGTTCNQGDMLGSDAAMSDCTASKDLRPHFTMTTIASQQKKCLKVCLEHEIGRNTVFSVNWDFPGIRRHVAEKLWYLISPTSRRLRHTASTYTMDDKLMMSSITVPDAETGIWNICIRNKAEGDVTFTTNVDTEAKASRCAIEAKGHLSAMSARHPDPIYLVVDVSKCMMPVLDALVTCQISRPNSPPATVMLRDDGMGNDDMKMDGIYSATFSRYMGDGQYNVHCSATCQRQHATCSGSGSSTGGGGGDNNGDDDIITMVRNAPKRMDDAGEENDQRMDGDSMAYPLDDRSDATGMNHCCFVRHLALGAFYVTGFEAGSMQVLEHDMVAPTMVNDLELVTVNADAYPYVISLRFKTTGDDMEVGDAMSYDLRWSGMFEALDTMFNYSMVPEVLTDRELDPLLYPPKKCNDMVPKTVEVRVRVCAPARENNVLFFGVKAMDEVGNVSPLSNVLRVEFPDPYHAANCPSANVRDMMTSPLHGCCHNRDAFDKTPPSPLDWDLEDAELEN